MRIFSKFKDYYDGAMGYGFDPKIIYKRHFFKIPSDHKDAQKISGNQIFQDILELMPGAYSHAPDFHVHKTIIIFFCGKVYPLIIFREPGKDSFYNEAYNQWFGYNFEFVHNLILDMGSKKQVKNYLHRKRHFARYGWYGTTAIAHQKNLDLLFDFSGTGHPSIDDLHHHYETPVIIYDDHAFLLNPVLKDYRLFMIIDPFTAFQEIAMYISGVLGGQCPPMVEISDRDRKYMHGFNKWSFRKEPAK